MAGFFRLLVPLSLVFIAVLLSSVFFLAPPAGDAGSETSGQSDFSLFLLHGLLLFAPPVIAWLAALLALRERGQRHGVRFAACGVVAFTAAAFLIGHA